MKGFVGGRGRSKGRGFAITLSAGLLVLAVVGPVRADTINILGDETGVYATATVVCEFNSQTNTFTYTATNTSSITQPGSTSTITAFGFDLPPVGNANAAGLNGFSGQQAPSLSSNFNFSDGDLGAVPLFNAAVLDFGFVTPAGTFASGNPNDGLLPGESASFTVSGAAFSGFTETAICNAIFVRFQNVSIGSGADTGVQGSVNYQPDGRIKRDGKPLHGNDVYNTTGNNQTIALNPVAGTVKWVFMTVQNDGDDDDSFSLDTSGASPSGYKLRYFRGNSTDELTAAVESDTYVTPVLAPGEYVQIRIKVKTTTQAQRGSLLTRLYTFTSETDSGSQDAVKLTVSRK